jgi:hypothetical protein
VDKSRIYLYTLLSPCHNILNLIHKEAHRTRRRLTGKLLSERSTRTFEPIMQEQIDIFIKHLYASSQSSDSVNVPCNQASRVRHRKISRFRIFAPSPRLRWLIATWQATSRAATTVSIHICSILNYLTALGGRIYPRPPQPPKVIFAEPATLHYRDKGSAVEQHMRWNSARRRF